MLKVDKSITISGQSYIGGQQVIYKVQDETEVEA